MFFCKNNIKKDIKKIRMTSMTSIEKAGLLRNSLGPRAMKLKEKLKKILEARQTAWLGKGYHEFPY